MSLPYYQMYPKDFDSNEYVRLMSRAQVGLYILLLNQSWVNDGLPAEPDTIMRSIKDAPREFRRDWPFVEPCFPVWLDGRRRNKRQEDEREHAQNKSAKARESGIKSGEQRRNVRSEKNEPTFGEGSTRASGSVSESGFEFVSEEKKDLEILRPPPDVSSVLEELKSIYLRAGLPIAPRHEQLCLQMLIALHPSKLWKVLDYVKWQLLKGHWRDSRTTKRLLNLLRDGDYDVELVERTLPKVSEKSSAEERHERFVAAVEQRIGTV
jgi:uncharacterized protein YdaU (DUF1376 family)